jgi:Fe-S cluster assembly scaffold protein SufB
VATERQFGLEPVAREPPMEYALELNRLIELQMEGAVG